MERDAGCESEGIQGAEPTESFPLFQQSNDQLCGELCLRVLSAIHHLPSAPIQAVAVE